MTKSSRLGLLGLVSLFLAGSAWAADAKPAAKKQGKKSAAAEKTANKKGINMTAVLETSMGMIRVKLFDKEAPETIANFVGLAEGTKEWTDPATGQKVKRRFYDGLTFHRVIPNFMIQGGCPLGTGTGGPGYQFKDEIVPSLQFNKPGLLAMANAGPGTNGSQFFITTAPTPWLNGHHTIFGEVIGEMPVVDPDSGEVIKGKDTPMGVVITISIVPRGVADRPTTPVVIKKLTIEKGK